MPDSSNQILIAGIGGVGGYFGGKLALKYADHPQVDVHFLARGTNLEAIQKNGLEVKERENVFVANPSKASENPNELGVQDVIVLCCKSYDLESLLEQIRPCVAPHTLLIPLLNGVLAAEQTRKHFPDNLVCDACVYIVSSLSAPGKIHNSGNIERLFFGTEKDDPRLHDFLQLLLDAGIDAHLRKDILSVIWEKFIFLSPTANATTFFRQPLGQVLEQKNTSEVLEGLLHEVIEIAHKKGIALPASIFSLTLEKMKALPYSTTSSMQRDAEQHKRTESEVLTNYVLQQAEMMNVDVPYFTRLAKGLSI